MVGIRRDIHQERTDQERLKLAASVLQQATEGIFILDDQLCYIDVNPFYEQLTGFTHQHIIGKNLFDITENYQSQQRNSHYSILQQLEKVVSLMVNCRKHSFQVKKQPSGCALMPLAMSRTVSPTISGSSPI